MKIKTQFVLTMLLFGIILAITASSAIVINLRLESTLKQEAIARNIAQGASELGYLVNDYLIYRESQQLNRWQSRFASFSEQVGKLKVDAPAQRALVQNILANQRRLKEVFDSVVYALGDSSPNKKAALDPALLQVSWSRMAIQSQGLISDGSRLSQLLDQQVEQLTETRARLIYFLVGLLGLFLLVSYMFTYRRILKSIAALQAGTKVIGYGNLDFKMEEKKKDEIGDLSRAFNQMAANLKAVTASKTDLEKEVIERKRAEDALRESEEHLRLFVEHAPAAVAMLDRDMRYMVASRRFLADYRISSPDIIGRSHYDVFPELPDRWKEVHRRCLAGAVEKSEEDPFPREDGALDWVRWEIHPWRTTAGEIGGIILFSEVITERKRAEEALKKVHDELEKRVQERTIELTHAIQRLKIENVQRKLLEDTLRESENQVRFFASQCLTAQETERRRIAGELHDSIAASLAATKFGIERASEELKRGNTDPEPLRDLAAKLTGIISEVRRIMADLRPSILDDLGIVAAMNWFCREYKKTYSHISVEQDFRIEEHEVPDSLKTPIFRISQEAMNNIAKYSKASVVNLSLRKDESRIQLTIQDDGQGFNMETVRKGLGFSTMRERAELSGGECRIESTSGAGTSVECSWPI